MSDTSRSLIVSDARDLLASRAFFALSHFSNIGDGRPFCRFGRWSSARGATIRLRKIGPVHLLAVIHNRNAITYLAARLGRRSRALGRSD